MMTGHLNDGKRYPMLLWAAVFFFAILMLSGPASADVANTVHNLSSVGPGTRTIFANVGQTDEVCVFCHTPHGSAADLPLWNHEPTTVPDYVVPDSSMPPWATLLTAVQQPDMGSRLCLACHDGTVALGALVNMPGPGSVGSVSMTGAGVAPTGEMLDTAYGYVGTDLTTLHPISIAVNAQLLADKNACNTGNTLLLQYPPVGDPVKLRPTGNTYAGQPGVSLSSPSGAMNFNGGVQCGTCHDPHNNANGDFLVKGTPLDQAPLCDTCHYTTCP